MASAPPPPEAPGFSDQLQQPPSYAEATGPQYTHGPGLPPDYTKTVQQGYPPPVLGQPYPPPGSYPSPVLGQAYHPPPVSVQTVYVHQGVPYGDVPVQTHCPACSQMVVTRLEHNSGTMAWLTCAGLFIFGCVYGCCLIPFCLDGLKDVTHRCPNCNNVLGAYKRL